MNAREQTSLHVRRCIKDLDIAHLRGGAAFARGAARALGWSPGKRTEGWIAVDAALVVLWADERADCATARRSDEDAVLHALGSALSPRTLASPTGRVWSNSVRDTMRAIYSPMPRTYREHLAIGARSIALWHCAAALAVISGVNLAARVADKRVQKLFSDLARGLRLDNDLRGVSREAVENSRANAVLLVRESLGERRAMQFVRDERDRYLSRADAMLNCLGESDSVVRLVRATLAGAQAFYDAEQDRYSAPTVS
jgi:hypothetical protein